MGTGAREQQVANVRPDRVMLTTPGTGPGQGNISRQEAAVILGLPGLQKDAKGDPIVVFQSMVPIEGRRRSSGNRIYFPLVGVTSQITQFAPELRFTAGRAFRSGLQELIASNSCRRQFVDLRVDRCSAESQSIDQEPGLVILGRGCIQVPIRGQQVPAHFPEAEVHQRRGSRFGTLSNGLRRGEFRQSGQQPRK